MNVAAGAILFRNVDSGFADECLHHARELFEFADTYRGTYVDAIPARDFYNSWNGFKERKNMYQIIKRFQRKIAFQN